MPAVSVQSSCTAMMLLAINILPRPTAAYPVVLNVTSDGNVILLGLGYKGDSNFGHRNGPCVCGKLGCGIHSDVLGTYPPGNEALAYEEALKYRGDYFLECKYVNNRSQKGVSCTQIKTIVCPHTSCTINIIINCESKKTVLIWDSAQNPSVLSFTGDVAVIDCCQSSTTTTEVTTFSTTSTTLTTIQSSNDPTTVIVIEDSSTTTVVIPLSISLSPDDVTINSTQLGTSTEQSGTNDTQSGSSNQKYGNNDDSALFSGQHIGITVGSVVAAILVTIAVMCVWFRLKTWREKNRKNDRRENTISLSGNTFDTQVSNSRHSSTERSKKASTTVALVSPKVQSCERESHLTHIAGDYTYIDIKSAASNKSSTALASQSPSAQDNHVDSTIVESVTGMQDSDYSHLGVDRVRPANLYNWLDQQKSSATIQTVIISAAQPDSQQRMRNLQTPNLTDHHIVRKTHQGPGGCESHDLYSNLGESRAPRENTYNYLHDQNDGPIRHAGIESQCSITKPNLQAISETTPSQNGHPQVFINTSEHKSLGVIDAVPYTYTQVTPKPSQQKYNDGNQMRVKNNQTTMTASTADQVMPKVTKSSQPSVETSVVKETLADKKENNAHSGEGYVYVNAAYSTPDTQDKTNASFSLEADTYANMAYHSPAV